MSLAKHPTSDQPGGPSIVLDRIGLSFPLRAAPAGLAAARSARGKAADVGGEIIGTGGQQFAVQALRDISLTVNVGDRLAIIGSNGAGKTTLLRLVAGILDPETGTRRVRGGLSTIFNIRLGFDLERSGYDNIVLRGLLDGRSRGEIDRRMEAIADSSGIGDYLLLPINTYSSGMLARLAFSIATAWDASILLMDEWIGAGDAAFLATAQERLFDYASSVQILLLATHSPGILRQMCNRAIVLSHGRIAFSGGVDDALKFFQEQY